MYKKALIFIFAAATFTLAACGDSGKMESADFLAPQSLGMAEVSRETADLIGSDAADGGLQFVQIQDRLIVRTGHLSIIVEDTEETMRMIGRLAEARGGWIVSSNVFESGGAKSGDITIRIPADRFAETLSDIKDIALEVPDAWSLSMLLPLQV